MGYTYRRRLDTMKKLLIVVDMQNDFITGPLGSEQAEKILPAVRAKIEENKAKGAQVLFTRDTHDENYLETQEGRLLPVAHCIKGTDGHRIAKELDTSGSRIVDKTAFGALDLVDEEYDEIELIGLCTDICVVSNALVLKARYPETRVTVDASCCAGTSYEKHKAALLTMKSCQVIVTEDDSNII